MSTYENNIHLYQNITMQALHRLPIWSKRYAGTELTGPYGTYLVPPTHPDYITFSLDSRRYYPDLPNKIIIDEDENWRIVDGVDTTKMLWMPPDFSDERIQQWEQACYNHWHHTYYSPELPSPSYYFDPVLNLLPKEFERSWKEREQGEEEFRVWANQRMSDETYFPVHYIRRYYPGYVIKQSKRIEKTGRAVHRRS